MGQIHLPGRVKLIVGLISRDVPLLNNIRPDLERAFRNKVDFESPLMDFAHTSYYRKEFGENLKRKFLSFSNLVRQEKIYRVKLKTNALERGLSKGPTRLINIDPGYLDLAKVVLFSTKDHCHRIYLGGGIFAEVTLFFRDGTFVPWPWTYPDYRTEPYIKIFNSMRERYKNTVKAI